MPSVTIDAGVLVVPSERGSVDDAHRYVETILDWSQLLDKPWVAIYMSERASDALFEDNLYPLREQLKRLFTTNGIVEYDVNTVAQVVDRLLQLTPSFEAYFSLKDVLTEDLSTEPDILQLCAGTRLRSDLARCIVLIAILRRHCQEPVCDHSLILRRAPRKVVKVRALIHLLEHERTDLRTPPAPPEYFEGDVLACDDFHGLIECLDEALILIKSADEVGIETAIRIAVHKFNLAKGITLDWDAIPNHRIGWKFHSTLKAIHPPQALAVKVLRAIVETLEKTNMLSIHILRTGPGGNDPQKVRRHDQAKAWRRDIDREYHLHYWSCEDGMIEFASLGVHDDFSIPE